MPPPRRQSGSDVLHIVRLFSRDFNHGWVAHQAEIRFFATRPEPGAKQIPFDWSNPYGLALMVNQQIGLDSSPLPFAPVVILFGLAFTQTKVPQVCHLGE